jgi:mono/diheme cytochrome c family protein
VPSEYAQSTPPTGLWTNRSLINRGQRVYAAKCAVCHGERGDGKGSAAAGLALKPPSLQDRAMMAQMSPAYSFWRVSEGGTVDPFKLGSPKSSLRPKTRR